MLNISKLSLLSDQLPETQIDCLRPTNRDTEETFFVKGSLKMSTRGFGHAYADKREVYCLLYHMGVGPEPHFIRGEFSMHQRFRKTLLIVTRAGKLLFNLNLLRV